MRSPVFRHAGSWRHAGEGGGVPPKSHPGGGAGLSHQPWCVSCCVSMLCCAMTACHHLRGGIIYMPIGCPRMSPTPRSAKYGVTHGCNPSRGRGNVRLWSSAPRVGRGVRCLHRGADAALRPDWRLSAAVALRGQRAGMGRMGCDRRRPSAAGAALGEHGGGAACAITRGEVIRYPARGCRCA